MQFSGLRGSSQDNNEGAASPIMSSLRRHNLLKRSDVPQSAGATVNVVENETHVPAGVQITPHKGVNGQLLGG